MTDRVIDTNIVTIVGKVVDEKRFSHEIYGEGFYTYNIEIPRLSDACDRLSLTVSERLLVDMELNPEDMVRVEGQLRSYNKFIDGSNRLVLTVFARDIVLLDKEEEIKNPNQIYLEGFVCKPPIYRETPFGREISDLLVAVNRPYNKSDYIPSIAWGRNARFSAKLNVGDHIRLWGRIQSREYQKKLYDGTILNKVAYEVSVSKMEKADEEAMQENEGQE
ncbi:single-strand binding protein/Primosomal replication protein n [Alkaliphilus metalliredigens QYMF]|uniref:Single-strand binding protein/Primosomal replication protein n n=1 Tax=Alkaliphilus metalliredigens (strain QYMF) TaxID=293826 RepID=A6TNM8_ALKMQ|nr:single-stranded DNA-binding protein [Alkaliphilus metalliredigens]ABR47796.1 single-strand binding protein/Primosomal replication protein n [Alkaliphilus metalliredigens QYMF]